MFRGKVGKETNNVVAPRRLGTEDAAEGGVELVCRLDRASKTHVTRTFPKGLLHTEFNAEFVQNDCCYAEFVQNDCCCRLQGKVRAQCV